MTLMPPAFNLPPCTLVKAVPRKCQANFPLFSLLLQTIKMSFCRGIQPREDEREAASSALWAEMPLKFQSHSRLINTWLKARLGPVSGLALPQCFEGFHTVGHEVSLRKSSPSIRPNDDYFIWHMADQRIRKLFLKYVNSLLMKIVCIIQKELVKW